MLAEQPMPVGAGDSLDPKSREMILRELYYHERPITALDLFRWHGISGLQPITAVTGMILTSVDVLEFLIENGDVVKSLQPGADGGWQDVVYYLSAREFVRMTDEDNRAKREQAELGTSGRIWRFLRRLFGRRG